MLSPKWFPVVFVLCSCHIQEVFFCFFSGLSGARCWRLVKLTSLQRGVSLQTGLKKLTVSPPPRILKLLIYVLHKRSKQLFNKNTLPWLFFSKKKTYPQKEVSLFLSFCGSVEQTQHKPIYQKRRCRTVTCFPTMVCSSSPPKQKSTSFVSITFNFQGVKPSYFSQEWWCFSSPLPPPKKNKKHPKTSWNPLDLKVGTSSTRRLVVRWHTSPRGQGFTEPRCSGYVTGGPAPGGNLRW